MLPKLIQVGLVGQRLLHVVIQNKSVYQSIDVYQDSDAKTGEVWNAIFDAAANCDVMPRPNMTIDKKTGRIDIYLQLALSRCLVTPGVAKVTCDIMVEAIEMIAGFLSRMTSIYHVVLQIEGLVQIQRLNTSVGFFTCSNLRDSVLLRDYLSCTSNAQDESMLAVSGPSGGMLKDCDVGKGGKTFQCTLSIRAAVSPITEWLTVQSAARGQSLMPITFSWQPPESLTLVAKGSYQRTARGHTTPGSPSPSAYPPIGRFGSPA